MAYSAKPCNWSHFSRWAGNTLRQVSDKLVKKIKIWEMIQKQNMFLKKRANVYLFKLGFFFIAVFKDGSFILYPNKILLRNPCQWRLLYTNLRIIFLKFQLFSISCLKSEPVMLDFANESLFWANISNRFAKTMKFFTIQFWTVHLCVFFTTKRVLEVDIYLQFLQMSYVVFNDEAALLQCVSCEN